MTQLNDCWPATSWALVDCHERPKAAYHTIVRALAPLAVGVMRKYRYSPSPNLQHGALCNGWSKADAATVIAHATPHVYPPKNSTFFVWICNSRSDVPEVTVELRFISNTTGKAVCETLRKPVCAAPHDTTEVLTGDTPGREEDDPIVLAARLVGNDGGIISRDSDWPQPLKHFTFPDRGLEIQTNGEGLTISAKRPVKGFVLQNAGVHGRNNCLDVMPGDKQTVCSKCHVGEVEWMYYGMKD